jgi:E3 ubiquitin-protein ligase DOA10
VHGGRRRMGVYFLVFFAMGYFVAGFMIYADRVVIRLIHTPFHRKMTRIMLLDIVIAIVVMIVKLGGR